MKYVLSLIVMLLLCVSFAYSQDLTYEVQISGTYESSGVGAPKKWTNWMDLDHAEIAFGTERIPNENVPDEISIDGDLLQDWYVDYDAPGERQRHISFLFDRDTMPYLRRKGLIGYALRYRVNANQRFSKPQSTFIDDRAGDATAVDATAVDATAVESGP